MVSERGSLLSKVVTVVHSLMDLEQRHAPSLSPDLWVRIFAALRKAVRFGGNDGDLTLKQNHLEVHQHLAIITSGLWGVNIQGLSAYKALTKLVWRCSLMRDINHHIYLDPPLSVIPTNIDLLTQLSTLDLSTHTRASGVTSLEWVTKLTSLQMTLCCCDVIQHVLSLTKLTYLNVSDQRRWIQDTLPEANLDMDRHRLQDLQELYMSQVMLQLGQGTAGLCSWTV